MAHIVHARAAQLVLFAAHFALVLDVTIVNVALPEIQEDLGISPGAVHWVVSAYALAFGGALVVGGRIADRIGHRDALAIGMAVFAVASVVCALATSTEMLVGARALQGLGAALAEPAAMGMLATLFPQGKTRDRALARWATVTAVAAVSGLIAGGALTQLLSWEWIFLINAPLGVLVPVLARTAPRAGEGGRAAAFDARAALLASGGLVALAAALGTLSAAGRITIPSVGLLVVAAILLVAFGRRDRRAHHPLVPRALVADARLVLTLATGAIGGALVLGSFLLLPLALQRELGLTPLETGLALLAARLPAMLWSSVVRRMLTAIGPATTAALGMAMFLVAELSFTSLGSHGLSGAMPGLCLVGLAVPCVFMSTSYVALGSVPAHEAGIASGLLGAAQFVGGSVGLAVIALGGAHGIESGAGSLEAGFWACAALAALGGAASLLSSSRHRAPALSTA